MGTTWYDTVATLGYLAAATRNVRLMSHVFILPYRHPLAVGEGVRDRRRVGPVAASFSASARDISRASSRPSASTSSAAASCSTRPSISVKKAFLEEYPAHDGPGGRCARSASRRVRATAASADLGRRLDARGAEARRRAR
ncbi:MAG: hypothetical protein U1E86_28590 [Burkholderiaceae bacterium]